MVIGAVGADFRPFSFGGSVARPSRFAGVPNLGKPLYREKAVYINTHKTAIIGPWTTQERRNTHFQ